MKVYQPTDVDSERLQALIDKARDHKMTPAERFEQRVSFVHSGSPDGMTKDQVRAMLTERDGDPEQIALEAAEAERAKVVHYLQGLAEGDDRRVILRIANSIAALAHHTEDRS